MKQTFILGTIFLVGNSFLLYFLFINYFCFLQKLNINAIYFISNIVQIHSLNKKSIIILLIRHAWQVDFNKFKVALLLSVPFSLTIGHVDIIRTKVKLLITCVAWRFLPSNWEYGLNFVAFQWWCSHMIETFYWKWCKHTQSTDLHNHSPNL